MRLDDITSIEKLSSFLRVEYTTLSFLIRHKQKIYKHNLYHKFFEKLEVELIVFLLKKGLTIKLGMPYKKFYVEELKIPKKRYKNEYRKVYKILNEDYLNTNKLIFFHLNKICSINPCAMGFVKGRNTVDNAVKHLNKKIILNIDIQNFFDSIPKKKVKEAFIKVGFNEKISIILSKLTTLKGYLPQGFYTSPILANLVVDEMDNELSNLASKYNSVYSRYADDITFSSDLSTPNLDQIKSILFKYGFSLNEKKTRYMHSGKVQYVTGLTVNDKNYPRIPKKMKRNIRLELYYMKKFGVFSHFLYKKKLDKNILNHDVDCLLKIFDEASYYINLKMRGRIDYINSVEPFLAKKLYTDLNFIKDSLMVESKQIADIYKKVKLEI